MLTYLTVDQVRTFMRLSDRAEAAGDRLVDRANKLDLGTTDKTGVAASPEQQQAWVEATDALRATELTGPSQALEGAVERLDPDARRELYAIAMIGRGDYAARQWQDALADGAALSDEALSRALPDMESLSTFLAKGLYQLKLS